MFPFSKWDWNRYDGFLYVCLVSKQSKKNNMKEVLQMSINLRKFWAPKLDILTNSVNFQMPETDKTEYSTKQRDSS